MRESTSETPSIVIAENEERLADLHAEWVKSEYSVTITYTATEARDGIHADTDVVLLDRRLPDGSGDEVLQVIGNLGTIAVSP